MLRVRSDDGTLEHGLGPGVPIDCRVSQDATSPLRPAHCIVPRATGHGWSTSPLSNLLRSSAQWVRLPAGFTGSEIGPPQLAASFMTALTTGHAAHGLPR